MAKLFFSNDQFHHVHDLHDFSYASYQLFSTIRFYVLQKPVLGVMTSFVLHHIC